MQHAAVQYILDSIVLALDDNHNQCWLRVSMINPFGQSLVVIVNKTKVYMI